MTPVQLGLRDLRDGLLSTPLAFSLALRELQTRYSRTTLGPLWITLAQAAWICGIAVVFSQVFRQEIGDVVYFLAAGVPVWTFMATVLTEAPITFVSSRGILEQFGAAWTVQVWKRVMVSVWVLLQHMTIWVVALFLFGPPLNAGMLMALVGLLILFVTAWGAMLLFGVLGARYRDLQPALTLGMNFMFVLTPVFWDPQLLGPGRPMITHLNPLYHFLEIVRAPLLSRSVAMESYIFCCVAMTLVVVLGCVTFARSRRMLFTWL